MNASNRSLPMRGMERPLLLCFLYSGLMDCAVREPAVRHFTRWAAGR